MGRNRALGSPYQTETVTEDFTTNYQVDAYMVDAVPLVVTLDPNAVNNDQVTIQDVTGAAGTSAIVINASEGQTILNGYGSTISIATNGGAVTLTMTDDGWVPEVGFAASPVPSTLAPNVTSSGTSPSAVALPAAGSGGNAAIFHTSNDTAGILTLVTGSGATAGLAAAVTFATPFAATPRAVILSPANDGAAGIPYDVQSVSATGFSVRSPASTPFPSLATLQWFYLVVG